MNNRNCVIAMVGSKTCGKGTEINALSEFHKLYSCFEVKLKSPIISYENQAYFLLFFISKVYLLYFSSLCYIYTTVNLK